MSKRASALRKERFEDLFHQFKAVDQESNLSNTKIFIGIQQFCLYIANYTSIKEISSIDEQTVEEFFSYLIKEQKRLGVNLTDIKRTILAIQDFTNISSMNYLFDFSLNNTSLWTNLQSSSRF
ncbi:swarming motility protein SwrAA [Bacillus carboniphilus]|uniref:Swarming motility protein SwrAA n=1 Tax=Bacillus carboniphilus TaxID=86663 RepID=A0ABY9JUX4_9BACI|nr:swarming motility protein SwrAA [Bacillus carboniphilus]WLR41476.1 swarming motility protein SwrAA [Bacillus carboniphilus]